MILVCRPYEGEILIQEEAYVKTDTGYYVYLLWSDNPPANPDTTTGVIGIYSYTNDGKEYEGGELDVTGDDFDLTHYIDECLNFVNLEWSSYEIIDEDTFDEGTKTPFRGWKFRVLDYSEENILCEDSDYETEQDAEDAARTYIRDNNITDYILDVSQSDF